MKLIQGPCFDAGNLRHSALGMMQIWWEIGYDSLGATRLGVRSTQMVNRQCQEVIGLYEPRH